MKNLPVFLSLSILLAGFGLFFFSSTVQAAPGDIEATLDVTNPEVSIIVGDYLYVHASGSPPLTFRKYNKNTLELVAALDPISGAVDPRASSSSWKNGLAYDGTYIWLTINEDTNGSPDRSHIIKINPSGSMSVVWDYPQVASTRNYRDIVYDGSQYLWVGFGGITYGGLTKINKSSHALESTTYTYFFPHTVSYDAASGYVYAADSQGVFRMKKDFSQSTYRTFSSLGLGIGPRSIFYRDGYVYGTSGQTIFKLLASNLSLVARNDNPGASLGVTIFQQVGYEDRPSLGNFSHNGTCFWFGSLRNSSGAAGFGVLDSTTLAVTSFWSYGLPANYAMDRLHFDAGTSKMWASGGGLGFFGASVANKVFRIDASGCPSANNPPNTPSNPSPADLASNVSRDADLSWTGGDPDVGDTVTYDVYFEANDATPDVLVSASQSATTYDPGTMSYGTAYYWQIVARDSSGVTTTGPVWRFTTQYQPTLDDVTINTSPILADGSTTHIITIRASDGNGAANLNDMRTLVNYQGSQAGSYRGYFRWDDTALDANWVDTGSCSGGGYYGKYSSDYGYQYVDLVSCNTSTSGNQRTVNFVFHANTNWGGDGPLTNNDISGWAMDDDTNSTSWSNFDLNFAVTPNTGTIQGYVWDDTNTLSPACTFTAGSDAKMAGRTVTATGPSSGSDVTDVNGNYSISDLSAGSYSVCVDLPTSEWEKICPTSDGTLCESASVTAGGTTTLNFGLKYEVTSWFQAVWPVGSASGDVHSNGSISMSIPSGKFLLSGQGVVSVADSPPPDPIATVPGGASEQNWNIRSYGNIAWPADLINSVTATDTSGTVKIYEVNDLDIDANDPGVAWVFDSNLKIIVANDITIDSNVDTEQINAILIAKGDITVEGTAPVADSLKIKGAVYVQGDLIINRELVNNAEPVMKIEFDPGYFIYSVPYFTQATHSWSEVR